MVEDVPGETGTGDQREEVSNNPLRTGYLSPVVELESLLSRVGAVSSGFVQ